MIDGTSGAAEFLVGERRGAGGGVAGGVGGGGGEGGGGVIVNRHGQAGRREGGGGALGLDRAGAVVGLIEAHGRAGLGAALELGVLLSLAGGSGSESLIAGGSGAGCRR